MKTKLIVGNLYTFHEAQIEEMGSVFVTPACLGSVEEIPARSVLMYMGYRPSTNPPNSDGRGDEACTCEECVGQNMFLCGETMYAVYAAEYKLKKI